MEHNRTLILVKPDGVKRGLIGEVVSRIERKGYAIEALKVVDSCEAQLREHYAEHAEKPFFPDLLGYMGSGPIVAIVAGGSRVVEGFRSLAGATNPVAAEPGTIRGDFGRDWGTGNIENIVHGSDAALSAEREIGIWFPELLG